MTTRETPTLTVWHEEKPIFTSNGNWLYPLFELEAYLAAHAVKPERLLLEDKIIGKAAAVLMHRMGFRTVKAGVLSRLGEDVLQRYKISYTYEQLVDRPCEPTWPGIASPGRSRLQGEQGEGK